MEARSPAPAELGVDRDRRQRPWMSEQQGPGGRQRPGWPPGRASVVTRFEIELRDDPVGHGRRAAVTGAQDHLGLERGLVGVVDAGEAA